MQKKWVVSVSCFCSTEVALILCSTPNLFFASFCSRCIGTKQSSGTSRFIGKEINFPINQDRLLTLKHIFFIEDAPGNLLFFIAADQFPS